MILNKTILILEDDLLTLSKILERLATIEQDQPYEFLCRCVKTTSFIPHNMNNDGTDRLNKRIALLENRVKKLEEAVFPKVRDDVLVESAEKMVQEHEYASASLLQRRLGIGYARAARILDGLEEKGIVGPGRGAKPRKVFPEKSTGQIFLEALNRGVLKSD